MSVLILLVLVPIGFVFFAMFAVSGGENKSKALQGFEAMLLTAVVLVSLVAAIF